MKEPGSPKSVTHSEIKEVIPKIRLQFFRHDEKAKAPEGTSDDRVRLTKAGRKHAAEAGKEKGINIDGTVIYGSPRDRSTETAYHRMLGEDTYIQGLSLEELRQTGRDLSQGIPGTFPEGTGPKKDAQTEALNFIWKGEFEKIAYKRYLESKDGLVFVFEDSDRLAEELKDTESRTYSRTAAEIAKLIERYIDSLPRWNQLSRDPKYADLHGRMERLFGSHQTVTESFLLKAVEVAKGRDAARKLLSEFKDKNGFAFSEGYDITLKPANDNADPTIELTYKNHHWNLTRPMLDRIIKEGGLLPRAKEVSGLAAK